MDHSLEGSQSRSRSLGKTRWVVFCALAAWIGVALWPIASLRAVNIQDDIFTSDLLNDRLPARAFVGQSLRAGESPFWMPGIYTGFPTLAQVEIGTLYPSNLVLFVLFSPYTAIAFAQLLPLLVAGLGGSLLALEYRLAVLPALLAGVSLSLSGFFVCHIRQLNMIDAACWFPLLLMFAERLLATGARREAAGLAAVWAISLLAGHPQISYYSMLVGVVYFVVRRWQIDRRNGATIRESTLRIGKDPRVGLALAAGVVGTVVAAAALLPALELVTLSRRSGGLSFQEAAAFPMSPKAILNLFVPYANGDISDLTVEIPGVFWEQYGYLGLLPMLLALIATVVAWRDEKVRLLAGIAIVGYVMALGANTPLFGWAFEWVPGMSYFRFPTRFILFVEVSIALLAAFGLARLSGWITTRGFASGLGVLVLAGTAADLVVHQRRQVPVVETSTWTRPVATAAILRQRGPMPAEQPWRYYSLETKRLHEKIFYRSGGWAGDRSLFVAAQELLQPSSNLLSGLESVDGYANLVPRHYEELWGSEKTHGLAVPSGQLRGNRWHLAPHLARLLALFNVRYVVSAMPVDSAEIAWIASTRGGVHVYEVPGVLPRAIVVGRTRRVESAAAALEVLSRGDLRMTEEALVEDDEIELPPDARSSRNVRVAERHNGRMRLEVSIDHPGLLVVSDGFYPGWRARVGERSVPIHRVNHMMRGVVVPAGHHEVELEFRSRVILWGFVLSALGVGAWVAMAMLAWRRSNAVQPGVEP